MDIAKEAPRAALGTEYGKLSGTMKIGEIGRLFPSPILPIFTGCKASGLAAFSRRARKRQECTFVWLQSLASNSGNNAFSTHQVTSAIAGPGTNRRFLPVAEIESAVRSSETSNLPCGELRRLSLRILTTLVGSGVKPRRILFFVLFHSLEHAS